jgi:hypothetical protein
MANLDNILNTVIPIVVILVFVGFIYWKMKKPADYMLGKIWEWLGSGVDSIFSSQGKATEIIYK